MFDVSMLKVLLRQRILLMHLCVNGFNRKQIKWGSVQQSSVIVIWTSLQSLNWKNSIIYIIVLSNVCFPDEAGCFLWQDQAPRIISEEADHTRLGLYYFLARGLAFPTLELVTQKNQFVSTLLKSYVFFPRSSLLCPHTFLLHCWPSHIMVHLAQKVNSYQQKFDTNCTGGVVDAHCRWNVFTKVPILERSISILCRDPGMEIQCFLQKRGGAECLKLQGEGILKHLKKKVTQPVRQHSWSEKQLIFQVIDHSLEQARSDTNWKGHFAWMIKLILDCWGLY